MGLMSMSSAQPLQTQSDRRPFNWNEVTFPYHRFEIRSISICSLFIDKERFKMDLKRMQCTYDWYVWCTWYWYGATFMDLIASISERMLLWSSFFTLLIRMLLILSIPSEMQISETNCEVSTSIFFNLFECLTKVF